MVITGKYEAVAHSLEYLSQVTVPQDLTLLLQLECTVIDSRTVSRIGRFDRHFILPKDFSVGVDGLLVWLNSQNYRFQ